MAHKLYDLKLGEQFTENNFSSWTRVPGGWVYGDMQGCCFVPFDNEFQSDVPQIKETKLTTDNSAIPKLPACKHCQNDINLILWRDKGMSFCGHCGRQLSGSSADVERN